jgi:Nuclease-related domain
MKSIFFALGRWAAIGVSTLSIATAANWSNYKSYWEGTIVRVQTTDFNLLSHILPTKLSYVLIQGDIEELQTTLDSNYGVFGMVVTNCTIEIPACPDQQILYQTQSKLRWSQHLKVEDLSSNPYDLLRNPPPLKATGGFESARATAWSTTGKSNSGQTIGRVYYVRGIAPDFWTDYTGWMRGLPGSLLSDHQVQKYYALTTSLFLLGGLTSGIFVEWILYGKRLQKRVAQQQAHLAQREKDQLLQDLMGLRQQIRAGLQQIANLKLENERSAAELASSQQHEGERIQELKQVIDQLEQPRSLAQPILPTPDTLEQNQAALQQEIQQREQTIATLQSQITDQTHNRSGSTQALEALRSQLQAMTQQQSVDKETLAQYEQDLAQLRQELARQDQEKQAKSSLIALLNKQLQDAQQQTIEAERQRAALEQSVAGLNQQQLQGSERLDQLEREIDRLRQEKHQLNLNETERKLSTNHFEGQVLQHLETSLKAQAGEWRVLPNLDVSVSRTDRQFTDFLVVGQNCVIVIEAKFYQGTIHAEGDARRTTWYCTSLKGTTPQLVKSAGKRNPHEQVSDYCDSVRTKLFSRKTAGAIRVYGVIVFPQGTEVAAISAEIRDYSRITTLDQLAQTIQEIESEWNRRNPEPDGLSPQQLEDWLYGRPILKKVAH